jgi:hypothetical protein
MKCPFFTRQLLDDSCHNGLSKLSIAPITPETWKTVRRNQSLPLVSDFDRQPSADPGLFYGILKRSIIGAP